MRFSVLVAIYNVEEYLEQCLDSLLNQEYDNYEVVLVDDGSTDKSGEICEKYVKNYPHIFRVIHKKNQGLISARRIGIENANSDFCVFVDSDDFVEANMLKIISEYLKKDENVDLLLYSFRYFRNGKKAERYHIAAPDGKIWDKTNKKEVYEKFIASAAFTSLVTKAIRTSILKEDSTNYCEYYDKNMSEDILQSIYPISAAKKIMYTDNVLYNYRINKDSISRSFYPSTIESKNTLHVYNEIIKYLPEWGMDCFEIHEKLKARWFNDFMYMLSKYYENAKSREERKAVIEYDWKKMLPPNAYDANNIYENESYKKLYCYVINNRETDIYFYFLKKKCYQRIKKWKRNIQKILRRKK